MKLHVAFHTLDLDAAITISKQIKEYVDQFHIGPVLLYKYGIHAIEQLKAAVGNTSICAETEIVNRGKDITSLCINAGADVITVMAGTHPNIIHAAAQTAGKKQTMLDVMDTLQIGQACMQAQNLGVDAILFRTYQHEGTQLPVPFDQWEMARGNTSLPLYIAGNINPENIEPTIALKPDGIIICSAITKAQDPVAQTQYFYNLIHNK